MVQVHVHILMRLLVMKLQCKRRITCTHHLSSKYSKQLSSVHYLVTPFPTGLSILQSAKEDDDVFSSIPIKTAGSLLLFPALQILATPASKSWAATKNREMLQDLAAQLFTFCESISFQEYNQITEKVINFTLGINIHFIGLVKLVLSHMCYILLWLCFLVLLVACDILLGLGWVVGKLHYNTTEALSLSSAFLTGT